MLQLGNVTCKLISVLFTDIRDFTKKVEKMEVNNVVDFLNSYYCFALPVIPRFRTLN
jgi:class 3 adenylate cyclase